LVSAPCRVTREIRFPGNTRGEQDWTGGFRKRRWGNTQCRGDQSKKIKKQEKRGLIYIVHLNVSVYDHPTKTGWQMIKISHGRKEKPEYIPFHGTRDEALTLEAEIRGTVNRSDPWFSDLLPEFRVAYRNRASKRGLEVMDNSMRHLVAFFGTFRMRHIAPSLIEQYKASRLDAGVKKRTVNIELSGLSAYITWLNETTGSKYQRPKRFTKRETRPPIPSPLSPAELVALFRHLQGDIRTMVEIMATCGRAPGGGVRVADQRFRPRVDDA